MAKLNIVHAMIVLAAIGIAATPAQAMKEPPTEPTTSSGGSTGGTPVPEPSSMLIFGAGAVALMLGKRRRKGESEV